MGAHGCTTALGTAQQLPYMRDVSEQLQSSVHTYTALVVVDKREGIIAGREASIP